MSIRKVTNSIVNIGVSDVSTPLFENQYQIPHGMAYNSYVIFGDKNVLMDTCDESVLEEWLDNLHNALAGSKLDYLVVSHAEPDHGAAIVRVIEAFPEIQVYGTPRVASLIKGFYNLDLSDRFHGVKQGDNLELSERTLTFYPAPMVHWPEVMFTYDDKDKVLFSADAFGRFGASDDGEDWDIEGRRYFTAIMWKFRKNVREALEKIKDLEITTICSLHGDVISSDIPHYMESYSAWASEEPFEEGVLIAIASIYGNTLAAGKEMAAQFQEQGVDAKLVDLCKDDMMLAVDGAIARKKVILGASTYNHGVFPLMEDFISRLKMRGFNTALIGIMENGSWFPHAGELMKKEMLEMPDIAVCPTKVTLRGAADTEARLKMNALVAEMLGDAMGSEQ